MRLSPSMLPPGLRELAQQEGLTDAQTRKLADAWGEYTKSGLE